MAYVYRHIRKDLNQPFYIGVSDKNDTKYKRAFEKHMNRRPPDWYKIIELSEYEIEILMENISVEKAHEKEQEFIKIYGRLDLGTGTLINRTDGGLGCINGITKETRKKMAAKLKGREQPAWQREILSTAAKGKKVWWKYKPVIQLDINDNYIRDFVSVTEAANELGLQVSNIIKVINGVRNHTGNYHFKYKSC